MISMSERSPPPSSRVPGSRAQVMRLPVPSRARLSGIFISSWRALCLTATGKDPGQARPRHCFSSHHRCGLSGNAWGGSGFWAETLKPDSRGLVPGTHFAKPPGIRPAAPWVPAINAGMTPEGEAAVVGNCGGASADCGEAISTTVIPGLVPGTHLSTSAVCWSEWQARGEYPDAGMCCAMGPRAKPEDDTCFVVMTAGHLPLSPAPSGERAEAGAVWPAEGEGRLLAPNQLPPLTHFVLAPLTLTLSPYRTGRGDAEARP